MQEYVLFTDSACDLDLAQLEEWNVRSLPLTLLFDDSQIEYSNYDLSAAYFYSALRDGRVAKTSSVSTGAFEEAFRGALEAGQDIIYLGFSSGLSGTVNAASIAADMLLPDYPERRIVLVDSLCASAGLGLLLDLCVQRRDAGASFEELLAYAERTKLHICHWFTVDDLEYLRRGGRISSAAANIGCALSIKPVLHMDNEGKLVSVSKARGRRRSLEELAKRLASSRLEGDTPVYISHGDCLADVQRLQDILQQKYKVQVKGVCDTGPVIGAHSGPGTVALFFVGDAR